MKFYLLSIVMLFSSALYAKTLHDSKMAHLYFKLDKTIAKDELFLMIVDTKAVKQEPISIYKAIKGRQGEYEFDISVDKSYLYISVYNEVNIVNSPKFILNNYIVEAADNVSVYIKKEEGYDIGVINYSYYSRYLQNFRFLFSGKGCDKYSCRFQMDSSIMSNKSSVGDCIDAKGNFVSGDFCDKAINKSFYMLNHYKNKLSYVIYIQMKLDIVSMLEQQRLYYYGMALAPLSKTDSIFSSKAAFSYLNKVLSYKYKYPDELKVISPYYSQWMSDCYSYFVGFRGDKRLYSINNLENGIGDIMRDFKGLLREKIIVNYFFKNPLLVSNGGMYSSLSDSIKSTFYLKEYNNLGAAIDGRIAYNFELTDVTGRVVRLSDFKGKVVFIDFWYKGCGACSQYYKKVLSAVEDDFKNNKEVVFIAINIDKEKGMWLDAIDSDLYTSKNVVNVTTGVNGIAHEVIKRYNVVGYPRPFLISKNGNIFNSNYNELRSAGAEGLSAMLNKALLSK